MSACHPQNRTDELRADPLPSMIEGDVKVADPSHRRIAEVGVTVQPADTDDSPLSVAMKRASPGWSKRFCPDCHSVWRRERAWKPVAAASVTKGMSRSIGKQSIRSIAIMP